jgi:hypothetical protein
MPLIPFDPCSGDTEPDDCTVLPDIGEAILALGLVGLEPFLPVGGCGYDFHTYLSMNKPVAEFYDALSIHLTDFGPGYPANAGDWGPWTDPDDPDTAQAASDGEVWVYMSPPIEFAGPEYVNLQDGDIEFWELRKNLFLALPEVRTILRFDTCCVFAAKATVPDAVT